MVLWILIYGALFYAHILGLECAVWLCGAQKAPFTQGSLGTA